MTDRHAGYIVTLAEDIREDDAEGTLSALRHVKGVVGVEPLIASWGDQVARMRADTEWFTALGEFIAERAKRARL